MIEGVQSARTSPTASTGTAKQASGGDFAAMLSSASTDAPSATADRFEKLQRQLRVPRGERWEAVPGRSDYADIVSGPRNGSFINLGDGPRRGEVFQRIRKDGREYHVYGEGRNRHVVELDRAKPSDRKPDVPEPSEVKPAEGETFEAVPGHRDYQRIEGGERDDQFINLSGNERTGRNFEIEERDGKRFHIYGEGRNQVEIRVGWRSERDNADGGRDGSGQPTGS